MQTSACTGIQLSGNEYELNREIGLHYQLHRGIGVHQSKANKKGLPLKVSVFIGGPPAHSVRAVMPLPEGYKRIDLCGRIGQPQVQVYHGRWLLHQH
jgi:4-hydroxy-3-polyprenylbenzoate decarboxylase